MAVVRMTGEEEEDEDSLSPIQPAKDYKDCHHV